MTVIGMWIGILVDLVVFMESPVRYMKFERNNVIKGHVMRCVEKRGVG